MKCSKCEFYSTGLRRCRLGKVNPPSLKNALGVADLMGTGAICNLNEHKEAVLKELGVTAGLL
jgi:hypothetical protein